MSDTEHAPSYREVLAAVIRRFIRLVGEPAALRVARKVPGLVIADDGSILDYNEADPTGTLNLLIDGYEVVFGDIAVTLAKQAAATTDPELVDYIGPPPPLTARLLLVDDHVLFRNGLASVFNYQPDFKVVGQAGSVREGLALARERDRQLHQLAERPQRQEQADKGKRLRPRHQPPPPAGDAQGHEQEHRAQADANDGTQGVAGVHVVDGGQ